MTEPEICAWLGVPSDSKLRPEIVAGMADVPVPADDVSEVAAFAAFLACAGAPQVIRRQ